MLNRTRRRFLEDSLFASAAAMMASQGANCFADDEPAQSSSPAEKLSVCVMGAGGRGGSHIGAYQNRKDTEINYICDIDTARANHQADEIGKKSGKRPQIESDIRRVLEDKSVDIVTIATPNHWHSLGAIWAMQAGKDVYVEKPVSHNVSEGRRVVETARKYDRICQCGTQSRSNPGMRAAIEYVKSGKLGEVKVARGLCYKRRGSIGPKGTYDVPATVNYDLWCGPATMDPVTRPKFHYDWHWIWNYGNGDLGNQGIHQMDIARWGLGVDELSSNVFSYGGRLGYEDAGETPNTQVVCHDYGEKSLVFEVRGLETEPYKGAGVGVIFECADGYLVIPNYDGGTAFDKDGKMIETFKGGGDHHHFENMLKGVRSRKPSDLNGEVLEGHLSSALCHTGNISYLLGQEVAAKEAFTKIEEVETNDNAKDTFDRTFEHLKKNKVDLAATKIRVGVPLACDPKSESFPDNADATTMCTREYRAPYIVPAQGEV